MRTPIAAILSCCVLLPACSHQSIVPSLPAQSPAQSFDAPGAAVAYHTLYSFKGQPDGDTPNPDLIVINGAMYGTTVSGGTANFGSVFKMTTEGSEQPIFSFLAGTGSNSPNGGVIEANGTFFGTTSTVVFAVKSGVERILHPFAGGADGYDAQGPLVFANGKLYGATQLGGVNQCNSGCGTIFDVTPGGSDHVLYKFRGGHDGQVPEGSLIEVKGTLYGTTSYGGAHNAGTVFKISASGDKDVLYSFTGDDDGSYPTGNLLFSDGTLYGTARLNGVKAQGTVFALGLNGKFTLLHGFTGGTNDGGSPNGGLVIDNGTLYGTTANGGRGDKAPYSRSTERVKNSSSAHSKAVPTAKRRKPASSTSKVRCTARRLAAEHPAREPSSNSAPDERWARRPRSPGWPDGRRAAVGLCDLHPERNTDS
jgi:uncharacterized repeat protein (TIGR03803 family)